MIKNLILVLFLSTIYLFRLTSSYSYDSDFGRDINDIVKITDGDLTLLGPKLSFGGIHTGPYYYYLFSPALYLFKNHPESMLYLNVAIFLTTFIIINKLYGISTALFLSTLPLTVYSARGPGNAFSYISALMLLLLLFAQLPKQNRRIFWLFYGIAAGIIINFHLINIIVFGCLFGCTLIYYTYKKDTKNIINTMVAVFGIIISFLPLILFEFTHNFVQFRNTFVDQSFKAFTNNTNLSDNPLTTSSNPLVNLWLLQKYFSTWSGLSFPFLLFINIILFIKTKHKSIQKTIIFFTSLLSLIVLAFIAQSQLAFHYFFPFIVITSISIIQLCHKHKFKKLIYTIIIGTNLLLFPTRLYTPTARNIFEYQQFSKELSLSELFKKVDKGSFNIYCARETTVAPLGWEYRYYLNSFGYRAKAPTEYAQSSSLLIIQESSNHETIDSLRSWEIDQFGPKKLVDKVSFRNRTIYLYIKK